MIDASVFWEEVFQAGSRPNLPDDEITVEMMVKLSEVEQEVLLVGYHLDGLWWVNCEGGNDLPLDLMTQQVQRWKY